MKKELADNIVSTLEDISVNYAHLLAEIGQMSTDILKYDGYDQHQSRINKLIEEVSLLRSQIVGLVSLQKETVDTILQLSDV